MTSPQLDRPLRTEAEAKRDRHAKRMRLLFASMDPAWGSIDFRTKMEDWTDYAHFDTNYTRRDVLRFMFKDLRTNLVATKGDLKKALSYMEDDAYSERCRQGYDDLESFSYDVDMQREMRAG